MKRKILFVGIRNGGRSQMAEAFLNHTFGEAFEAHSAGIDPGRLNPIVVEVMREIGLDISRNQPKSALDLIQSGKKFDYVIAIWDEMIAERSSCFPVVSPHCRWSFPDPADIRDTPEQTLVRTRVIRDAIRAKVAAWCNELVPSLSAESPLRAATPSRPIP